MQVAVAPVLLKVTTRRDDFCIDEAGVGLSLDLAEVGGLAAPQQGFEEGVLFATPDVHLDITAAGCAARVVGRPTWSARTGIGVRSDRELVFPRRWWRQVAVHHLPVFDDPELILAQPTGLGLAPGKRHVT